MDRATSHLVYASPSSTSLPTPSSSDDTDSMSTATLGSKPKGKYHGRGRSEGHIPRPPNAFILFRSDFLSKGIFPPNVSQQHKSRIAGKCWTKLPEAEVERWTAMARKVKEEHRRMYPDFKYKPTPKGPVKRRRQARTKEEQLRDCEALMEKYLPEEAASMVRDQDGEVVVPRRRKAASCRTSSCSGSSSGSSSSSSNYEIIFMDPLVRPPTPTPQAPPPDPEPSSSSSSWEWAEQHVEAQQPSRHCTSHDSTTSSASTLNLTHLVESPFSPHTASFDETQNTSTAVQVAQGVLPQSDEQSQEYALALLSASSCEVPVMLEKSHTEGLYPAIAHLVKSLQSTQTAPGPAPPPPPPSSSALEPMLLAGYDLGCLTQPIHAHNPPEHLQQQQQQEQEQEQPLGGGGGDVHGLEYFQGVQFGSAEEMMAMQMEIGMELELMGLGMGLGMDLRMGMDLGVGVGVEEVTGASGSGYHHDCGDSSVAEWIAATPVCDLL